MQAIPGGKIPNQKLPGHVAFILDGNGRWAAKKKKPAAYGHQKGVETVEHILEHASDRGIKTVTLYAFSSENWKRSEQEKRVLFRLLKDFFTRKINKIIKKNARIIIIGDTSKFSSVIQKTLSLAEFRSRHNSSFLIQVALSYGGRNEIIRAFQKYMREGIKSGSTMENIRSGLNETVFSKYLDTASAPDPDLLIRTGGEYRISNFLLYQSAYTEFYFTPTLWPDFSTDEFDRALDEYAKRERRFGGRLCSSEL